MTWAKAVPNLAIAACSGLVVIMAAKANFEGDTPFRASFLALAITTGRVQLDLGLCLVGFGTAFSVACGDEVQGVGQLRKSSRLGCGPAAFTFGRPVLSETTIRCWPGVQYGDVECGTGRKPGRGGSSPSFGCGFMALASLVSSETTVRLKSGLVACTVYVVGTMLS